MVCIKRRPSANDSLLTTISKGTIAGEGAAFFVLSAEPSTNDLAVLEALHTFYKPANKNEVEQEVAAFLQDQSLTADDIDVVITGNNGDVQGDAVYQALENNLFKANAIAHYKHLCGEYPTSTAFALWLAANVIKEGRLPAVVSKASPADIKRVLVYNHYENIHHSLMLLNAC